VTGSLGNIETFTASLAGNSERIDTIMSKADGVMTKADAVMSGLDRLAGGKHGGELLQAVTSIRELAESFDKRSGALMADGRRTLGDVSQAVNNLDKNPTRLLFGASSNSASASPREKKRPARSRQ
jgi:phospholipid/cholesterol/gamma-HCH transport system substrate-binding protein